MTQSLFQPLTEYGIKHTHFFEGQILTADAMRVEQKANREQRRLLGRSLGTGVLEGLMVSVPTDVGEASGQVVRVTAGIAVNRQGDVLQLPIEHDIPIVIPADEQPLPPVVADFTDCQPSASGALLTLGIDAYVLTLAPAATYQGRAPKSGFDNGRVSSCGSRYEVAGVQLRLLRLPTDSLQGLSETTRTVLSDFRQAVTDELFVRPSAPVFNRVQISMVRNLLAHCCFGTEAQLNANIPLLPADPDHPQQPRYGALDQLLELSDCEVPLALIYWAGQVVFADMWSVRRPLHRLESGFGYEIVAGARRLAEGEAMFRQFLDQLNALQADSTVNNATVRAREYFRYLPPLGMFDTAAGFNENSFFEGFTRRKGEAITVGSGATVRGPAPQYLDARLLRRALYDSFEHQPVDLEVDRSRNRPTEMFWVYAPIERDLPENTEQVGRRKSSLRVFTSACMPPYHAARFDAARWDVSNYDGVG